MELTHGGAKLNDLDVGYRIEIDPRTGAPTVQVPVPAPRARRGRSPRLVLVYAAGGPAGPFGQSWTLGGLQSVSLDLRHRHPRWDGSDGFALDGDPLVAWEGRGSIDGAWSIGVLRSRRGSHLTRVEKWVEISTGRVHFRTRDPDGAITIYGARPDAAARIADPDDESRTAVWLPELQIDPAGNAIWMEYAEEDLAGVDRAAPFEPMRPSRAQRYLKRIRYGNATPLALDDAAVAGVAPAVRWCFELVIDYGDHGDPIAASATADRAWPARVDPCSSFRFGFEVRTHRLARRVMSFRNFAALGSAPVMTGALTLDYDASSGGSRLREIGYIGVRHDGGAIDSATVPPLRLEYSPTADRFELHAVPTAREQAPVGLGSARSRVVDLYGEGLTGVLTENEGAWYYQRNLGGGHFEAAVALREKPAVRAGTFGVGDLDRDGDTDVATSTGRMAGCYQLDREEVRWEGFRPFAATPHVEAFGGRAQRIDLDGDGRPDVVVATGRGFTWFPSEGDGFRAPIEIALPSGADTAPTLNVDPTLDFTFADMTGDGLADLVRVQNGRVEYWPALGNGRFAERVVMDGAPQLSGFGELDHSRLHLVDLDGSGCSSLVYVGDGEIRSWRNLGGNRLVSGPAADGVPYRDRVGTTALLDFLGDGRPCVVWSSPLPGASEPVTYLPLSPPGRPGLLVAVADGRGRRTTLTYGSSASHYLRDLESGRGWATRMPAHHLVVDQVDVEDEPRDVRSTTRYRYHDGYFDGNQREPRGFGQVDVEDADLLIQTWFHLGTPMWNHHRPMDIYAGDPELVELSPHVIEGGEGLSPDELADGLTALAGQLIRREMFQLDGDGRPGLHPLEVEQHTHELRVLQATPLAFAASVRDRVVWQYEAEPGDPRITHDLALATDDYGQTIRSARIGYPRRMGRARDHAAQDRAWIALEDRVLRNLDDGARYQLGVPIETRRFELAGVLGGGDPRAAAGSLRAPLIDELVADAAPHHVELSLDSPRARWRAHGRSRYWNDAGGDALPLGEVGSGVLLHHEEVAAFHVDAVAIAYGDRVDDARLEELGYLRDGDTWWKPGETVRYTPAAQFAQRVGSVRADGASLEIAYDPDHLVVIAVTDPVGNTTSAEIDYHTLAPWRLTGPNGAVSEVRYDPLGVVVASSTRGQVGDQPWGFEPIAAVPRPATLTELVANAAATVGGCAHYYWYDLDAWRREGTPRTTAAISREALVHDGAGATTAMGPVQIAITYHDGSGERLQAKTRVGEDRWRTSGFVELDSKRRAVRAGEPFFSPTFGYQSEPALHALERSPVTRYDGAGRAIAHSYPDGSFDRTTYRAWSAEMADRDDTVLDSLYRALREGRPAGDPERQAYQQAAARAGTIQVAYRDPLGRVVGTRTVGDGDTLDRTSEARLDLDGLTRAAVDARGLIAFRFLFDMTGRELHRDSVDAGAIWTLADPNDRTVTTWNARGVRVDHTYDAGDRLIATDVRGGPAALDHRVHEVVYGESLPADEAVRRNLRGRAAMQRDSAGEVEILACDPAGAILAERRRLRADDRGEADWRGPVELEPDGFTTSAALDGLGRTHTMTLPDGSVQRFERGPDGVVARVRVSTPGGALSGAAILDGSELDALGRCRALRYGNGVAIERTFTDDGRLATQVATAGARALQRARYTYDPAGLLVRIEDDAQDGPGAIIANAAVGARRDFTYDAFGRLRTATGRVHGALEPAGLGPVDHLGLGNGSAIEPYTRRYDYDPNGNLLAIRHASPNQSWTTAMWVAPGSNRSVPELDGGGGPISDPEAMFDAGGNLTSLSHLRRMEWGWRNELVRAVAIERPGGSDDAERYVYAGDGSRVRKVSTRVVDGEVEETEKLCLGAVERKRVRRGDRLLLERWTVQVGGGGGERIALVHRWTTDELGREVDAAGTTRVHYQLTTQQGSSAVELDEAGQVISYEEYFPHGGTALFAGDDARGVARKDYRYCGKERDRATGLDYYGHRYLAPWIGRWLSPDPIGAADELNLYQFVGGDPIGKVDPDGLDPDPEPVPRFQVRMQFVHDVVRVPGYMLRPRLGPPTYTGDDPITMETVTQTEGWWKARFNQWAAGTSVTEEITITKTFRDYVAIEELPDPPAVPVEPRDERVEHPGDSSSPLPDRLEQFKRDWEAAPHPEGFEQSFPGEDGSSSASGNGTGTSGTTDGGAAGNRDGSGSDGTAEGNGNGGNGGGSNATGGTGGGTSGGGTGGAGSAGAGTQPGGKGTDPEGTPGATGTKRREGSPNGDETFGREGGSPYGRIWGQPRGVRGGTGLGSLSGGDASGFDVNNGITGNGNDPSVTADPSMLDSPFDETAAHAPKGNPGGTGQADKGDPNGGGGKGEGAGEFPSDYGSILPGDGEGPWWWRWIFGHAEQIGRVVGGAAEVVAAVPLLLAPEPVATKAAAVVLILNGLDNIQAGFTGEPTYTSQMGSGTATALGADKELANAVGMATDMAVPLAAGGIVGATRLPPSTSFLSDAAGGFETMPRPPRVRPPRAGAPTSAMPAGYPGTGPGRFVRVTRWFGEKRHFEQAFVDQAHWADYLHGVPANRANYFHPTAETIRVIEYEAGGVYFDTATFDDLGAIQTLDEFKSNYSGAIRRQDPSLIRSLQRQADRQLAVADDLGLPLRWYVRVDQLNDFQQWLGQTRSALICWMPY